MDFKPFIGLALGFGIGFLCRNLDIPVPSSPSIVGALLVVAMTAGYVATGALLH